MGLAANSLSKMIDEEVNLSIPDVEFLAQDELRERMARVHGEQSLTAVMQEYEGDIRGVGMLLFAEEGGLALVRAMLKEGVSLNEITDLEQEALAEVGNILLNACFGALANQLKMDVSSGLPVFHRGSYRDLFNVSRKTDDVMLLKIEFDVPGQQIQGFMSFTMNLASIQKFEERIRQFLGNIKVS